MRFGENIEEKLGDFEVAIQMHEIDRKEVQDRKEALEAALGELGEDVEVAASLRKNLEDVNRKTDEIRVSREALSERLEQFRHEIASEFDGLDKEEQTIQKLASMGEDISETHAIINDRREWLSACQKQVDDLEQRLNTTVSNGFDGPAISDVKGSSAAREVSSFNDLERAHDNVPDAKRALDEYMFSHKYTDADYLTYARDPEWQRLHKNAFPEHHVGKRALDDYMFSHHYTPADYGTYSKDPEWRRLHKEVFPEWHEHDER